MNKLEGRQALVTGAARGIGRAIAKALASEGADIAINYQSSEADAVSLADELSKAGRKTLLLKGNVGERATWNSMIEKIKQSWGRLDILVNNAGIQHVARIENFPVEKWDSVIAINLSSAFHATRLALPAMQAANNGKGWGRIINVASVHGLVASAEKSAYVTAKHGVVGLTKVTALENATTGVTCNAICPGWVLTPLVQKQVDAKATAGNISNAEATKQLLSEKEPSLQFLSLIHI